MRTGKSTVPILQDRAMRSTLPPLFVMLIWMLFSIKMLAQSKVSLAANSKAKLVISLPVNPTISHQFAASELAKYLHQISGAQFQLRKVTKEPAIILQLKKGGPNEAYLIQIKNSTIRIT